MLSEREKRTINKVIDELNQVTGYDEHGAICLGSAMASLFILLEASEVQAKEPRKPRPGFRYFECQCGHEWLRASRDADSPSGEECNACDAFAWCEASRATSEQFSRLWQ